MQITEAHVEAAFYNLILHGKPGHDQDYCEYTTEPFHWDFSARQVRLPSGVMDIFGYRGDGTPFVAEVKKDKLSAATVGQLIGYIGQVDQLYKYALRVNECNEVNGGLPTRGILVGRTADDLCLRAASAFGIDVYTYDYVQGEFYFFLHADSNEFQVAPRDYDEIVERAAVYATAPVFYGGGLHG
jgi:hypothetical protein